MASVRNPTYLLAPNWNYRPGGPIALGNIVGDPFRPHRWLSQLAAGDPAPDTETSTEINWRVETENIRGANISLWTQIFDLARFDVGARRSKATTVTFDMSQLDTIYFINEPSVEDVAGRMSNPRVRAALKAGSWPRRGTVYMVTGLKIARGFKLARAVSTDKGGSIGVGSEVAPAVSAGGGLELSKQTRRTDGFEATDDIIFAYQLLRIRLKGRGENETFDVDEFHDKAAFLSDDGEEERDEQLNVETDTALVADLAKTQKGLTVNPDGDQHIWLFPTE
jgi:hypothetical protein